jgi:plasmid stabilization system protein ParE
VSGPRYRLTDLADADIDEILTYTHREFGPRQFEAYWSLIDKAGQMVGEDPLRPGSCPRDELGQGVPSFAIDMPPREKARLHTSSTTFPASWRMARRGDPARSLGPDGAGTARGVGARRTRVSQNSAQRLEVHQTQLSWNRLLKV